MNLQNLLKSVEQGSYTFDSLSPDGKFVKFTNGEITTKNHIIKVSDDFEWTKDGNSFTLPTGWRTFTKSGLTFFTSKEEQTPDLRW
jgi:hypothetical protein